MSASVKIKNLAPGAIFDIGPTKAVILEHFPTGKTLLAAAESIGNRPLTVRPFTYNRANPEPNPNNFAFASLRYDLNTDFLGNLDAAGVIPADRIADTAWDLSDHDGGNRYGSVTCKIGLLSEAQYKKYIAAGLIPNLDDWEWTLTPNAGYAYDARLVYSDGSLSRDYACRGNCGVRPAFYVESEICLTLEEDEADLSDSAMLRDFTSKQLVEEVLRRIAAGEGDEDE